MVLESLINPFRAKKKPWELFFIGFLYNTVAVFLSLWIFETQASLVMVFLTVFACVPLIYNTIKLEEKIDVETKKYEMFLLKEHSKVLFFLMFLFFGMTLSVALWYVVLPGSMNSNLFTIQTQTIDAINYHVTGDAIATSTIFFKIFFNNLKVSIFCLLFAFFYGFGAIFILTWNASVIGVAIGNYIKNYISQFFSYFTVIPLAIFKYMIHGSFEIAAYFVAGLAGGIISIAVIKHDFGTEKFETVLLDSVDLVLISVILLIIAALIEVFITPVLF
jgi:uncharacterized membrane protein SpoIIM required for sporulation